MQQSTQARCSPKSPSASCFQQTSPLTAPRASVEAQQTSSYTTPPHNQPSFVPSTCQRRRPGVKPSIQRLKQISPRQIEPDPEERQWAEHDDRILSNALQMRRNMALADQLGSRSLEELPQDARKENSPTIAEASLSMHDKSPPAALKGCPVYSCDHPAFKGKPCSSSPPSSGKVAVDVSKRVTGRKPQLQHAKPPTSKYAPGVVCRETEESDPGKDGWEANDGHRWTDLRNDEIQQITIRGARKARQLQETIAYAKMDAFFYPQPQRVTGRKPKLLHARSQDEESMQSKGLDTSSMCATAQPWSSPKQITPLSRVTGRKPHIQKVRLMGELKTFFSNDVDDTSSEGACDDAWTTDEEGSECAEDHELCRKQNEDPAEHTPMSHEWSPPDTPPDAHEWSPPDPPAEIQGFSPPDTPAETPDCCNEFIYLPCPEQAIWAGELYTNNDWASNESDSDDEASDGCYSRGFLVQLQQQDGYQASPRLQRALLKMQPRSASVEAPPEERLKVDQPSLDASPSLTSDTARSVSKAEAVYAPRLQPMEQLETEEEFKARWLKKRQQAAQAIQTKHQTVEECLEGIPTKRSEEECLESAAKRLEKILDYSPTRDLSQGPCSFCLYPSQNSELEIPSTIAEDPVAEEGEALWPRTMKLLSRNNSWKQPTPPANNDSPACKHPGFVSKTCSRSPQSHGIRGKARGVTCSPPWARAPDVRQRGNGVKPKIMQNTNGMTRPAATRG